MTSTPDAKAVLAKATLVAACKLGFSYPELAGALNVSESTIANLHDNPQIDPASPMGERATLLVRLSKALSALCGDDPKWMKHFMTTHNLVIGSVPAQQISSAGLSSIVDIAEALARR